MLISALIMQAFIIQKKYRDIQLLRKQFSYDRAVACKLKKRIYALLFVKVIFCAALPSYAGNLLFKSNFGPGVSLSQVYDFSGNTAWQDIIGTDQETGYSWPVKALGSQSTGLFMKAIEPLDATNVGDHFTNNIRSVIGPNGASVNELFQRVKIKEPVGSSGAYTAPVIRRDHSLDDIDQLYITYWFRHPANLEDLLDNTVNEGNWRVQFEWKTGGYNNNNSFGDYRFMINIVKGYDGQLLWRTIADNGANNPWPKVQYWRIENKNVPVPVGEWFKFEVYWKRSGGSDGRFWAAVNGQVIVDRLGANLGDYQLPVTRLMYSNSYTGGYAPVDSHSTGLEIWDDFPCGNGLSCFYLTDNVAPTAPSSLTSNLSVGLSWGASTDNWGVVGYKVFRNGTEIGVSSTTSYVDTLSGGATGTKYNYKVKAFDAAGNLSPASNVTSITY